jgi:hypothetical protein
VLVSSGREVQETEKAHHFDLLANINILGGWKVLGLDVASEYRKAGT